MQDIEARVYAIINSLLPVVRDLEDRYRLAEDLDLDSLDRTELAVELENHFGIVINDQDQASLKRVGDVTDFVGRAIEQKARAA